MVLEDEMNESVITMLCGIRDLGNFSNNGIVNLPP